MKNKGKIIGTVEAWEDGSLGRDAEHAAPASAELAQQVDDALGLQMISIRLHKELIDDFKMIAQFHKLGYQPLMRDALKRFAEAEVKKIAIQYANERAAREQSKVKPETCGDAGQVSDSGHAKQSSKHPEKKVA